MMNKLINNNIIVYLSLKIKWKKKFFQHKIARICVEFFLLAVNKYSQVMKI